MTQETTAATEAAANPEAGQQPITLGPADLSGYANIIKAAMDRGAFKAEEFSQVGQAFDKLTAFLKQIAPQAEAPVEQSAQEAPQTESE